MTSGISARGSEGQPSAVPSMTRGASAEDINARQQLDELSGYATLAFSFPGIYGVIPRPYPNDSFNASNLNTLISVAGTAITSGAAFVQTHLGRPDSFVSYNIFDPAAALRERLLERISEVSASAENPIYEPDPQPVNWARLCRLRGIGAHESDDLYNWYAQKEE
jgi:hypothetical protein